MTTENPTAPTSQLDETLKETDIGNWIYENKSLFIGLLIGAIIATIGFSLYKIQKEKSHAEYATTIFNYKDSSLKNFQDDKLGKTELVAAHKKMVADTNSFAGAVGATIETSDFLAVKKNDTEALQVLNDAPKTSSSYATYFVETRKAVLLENLGQNQEAITVLESISQGEKILMEAKVRLDLGRLYLATGNKEKAKTNFEYVVNNLAQAEFVKLAKLYLADMAK